MKARWISAPKQQVVEPVTVKVVGSDYYLRVLTVLGEYWADETDFCNLNHVCGLVENMRQRGVLKDYTTTLHVYPYDRPMQ